MHSILKIVRFTKQITVPNVSALQSLDTSDQDKSEISFKIYIFHSMYHFRRVDRKEAARKVLTYY